MAEKTTDELALRGAGPGTGKTPGATLTSLSSKVVHADDNISAHRAVAPAMHVSTTFRYDDDPDQLKMWVNTDVSKVGFFDLSRHSISGYMSYRS
jgi:hypothetical protein